MDLNQKELENLAKMSNLSLNEKEKESFAKDLNSVIKYIQEIENLQVKRKVEAVRNKNVFREDKAKQNNSKEILESAPKSDESYFIVPKILKQ